MLKVRGSSEVDILPFSENVYNLHDVCYDAIFITNKHSRVQLTLTLQEGGGSQ